MTSETNKTPDQIAHEINRCLHSLSGSLQAIADELTGNPAALELIGLIHGGLPEITNLAEHLDGGHMDHSERRKSRARGYQVTVLLREDHAHGHADLEAWKQDPEEWLAGHLAARNNTKTNEDASRPDSGDAASRARGQERRCLCGPPGLPVCRCGHTSHWHGAPMGQGECEHDARCGCRRFQAEEPRRVREGEGSR